MAAGARHPPATSVRELWRNPGFRALAASSALTSLGNGAFAAVAFLYYTHGRGLSPSTVGTALTVVGVASIVASLPAGPWLDRVDAAAANAWLLVAQAVAVAAVGVAPSVATLLVAVAGVTFVSKVKLAARGALIARVLPRDGRTAMRAWLRSITNAGIGVGSAAAAASIAVDTPASYRLALAGVAATYVIGAVPLRRLRGLTAARPAAPAAGAPRRALRDRRYVLVAAISGLMGVHYLFLQVGLPLWVLDGASRPLWIVSAALTLNTIVVATCQVPLARPVRDVRSACVATAGAGGCLLVACAVVALAGRAGAATVPLVLAAAVVYSLGEVLQAAGAWELSFELAPAAQAGEYQTLFSSGQTAGTVLAPMTIATVLTGLGDGGWLVLGGLVGGLGWAHLAFARLVPAACARPSRAPRIGGRVRAPG